MAVWEPSGVITLTTDFGLQDPFVGVMKGRILQGFAAARIVDLTHHTLAHWPAEAGFWLARSFEYFPRGTVHVAVVDPGVGTARAIAVVEAAGHVLLAPDNGLLAAVVARHPAATLRHLDAATIARLAGARPSATFHGRDIFAPVAAALAAGRCGPAELGPRVAGLIPGWIEEPVASDGALSGVVVTIDHFGNLITNLEGRQLQGWVEPHVYAGSGVYPLRRTYGDVAPGSVLALVNSFGVIEIALAEGHAADRLGLSRGAPVVARDAVRRS